MRRVMAAHLARVHLSGTENIGPDAAGFNRAAPAAAGGCVAHPRGQWKVGPGPGQPVAAWGSTGTRVRQETPDMLTNTSKAEMLDQLTDGPCRTSGSQHVVVDKNPIPRQNTFGMQFQGIGPVFQLSCISEIPEASH